MVNSKMLYIYCDGGAAPNPGHGSIGFVIYRNKKIIMEGYQYIGKGMTNNQCEFIAVANALSVVRVHYSKEKKVRVYTDSALFYGATLAMSEKGYMNIKDKKLKALLDIIVGLLVGFVECEFVKIPREENKLADKLCQIGREQKKTKVIQHAP